MITDNFKLDPPNVLDYAPQQITVTTLSIPNDANFSRRGTRLINAGLYEDIETQPTLLRSKSTKSIYRYIDTGDTMSDVFKTHLKRLLLY